MYKNSRFDQNGNTGSDIFLFTTKYIWGINDPATSSQHFFLISNSDFLAPCCLNREKTQSILYIPINNFPFRT
ncbi:MAG TPA: hypothetical protein DCF33_09685 [Saprospirales bacterium]|nr:hypothetical protein [Saprospirales bacterium]